MSHVVLLGDSILANAAYTTGEPDVIAHLRAIMPKGWQATLAAVDGATIRNMGAQLRDLPAGATDLVVSIGGNDALSHMDVLNTPVGSVGEALEVLSARVSAFEHDYRAAVLPLEKRGLRVTLCTIYNGWFADPRERTEARMALAMFNDVILRTAFDAHFGVLELRHVCTEAADFANPIEASGAGGRKIAEAIVEKVSHPWFPVAHT